MIAGRVLHVDGNRVWLACGRTLWRSVDNGLTWHERAILPVAGLSERLVWHPLGRRLGRVGFHHFVPTGADSGVVIGHRHVFRLAAQKKELERVTPLIGSRPLSLCVRDSVVYYGEYRANPQRQPMCVWAAHVDDLRVWEPVCRLDKVRHIHGVFDDPYGGNFWITTGDNSDESGIWVASDDFRHKEQIAGGSQRYRVVQLLFTEDYVYFGSDAPLEKNYIYGLERATGRIEVMVEVNGPVFYGCKVGNHLFLSTAVEPSTVNQSRYAELWGAQINNEAWYVLRRFRKDAFSMKYLQYGQILFPSGPGDDVHLWCTPLGTEHDQKTLRWDIRSLTGNGN